MTAGRLSIAAERAAGTAVARAISRLGEERGRRIRERVDADGQAPTLDNLYKYYDLPIGEGWESTVERTDTGHVETVTYCPLAEVWRELGAPDRDVLYCDIDMAIIRGYNPDIRIERCESLLAGDGRCVYKFS